MNTKLFFALLFIVFVNLNSCDQNSFETASKTQNKCCGDDLDPIDD